MQSLQLLLLCASGCRATFPLSSHTQRIIQKTRESISSSSFSSEIRSEATQRVETHLWIGRSSYLGMCLVLRGNWVLEVPPSVLTTQNIKRDLLLWKELEQTISPVPSLSEPQAAKYQVLWEDSELTDVLSVRKFFFELLP